MNRRRGGAPDGLLGKGQRKGKCSLEGSALCDVLSTQCICAVAAWWFDDPRQKVVPGSRIPRSTSHFVVFLKG